MCGKEFFSRTNFQVHMRIHNTYTCDKCGISIQGYNIMRAHKRREHPDPSQVRLFISFNIILTKFSFTQFVIRPRATLARYVAR